MKIYWFLRNPIGHIRSIRRIGLKNSYTLKLCNLAYEGGQKFLNFISNVMPKNPYYWW